MFDDIFDEDSWVGPDWKIEFNRWLKFVDGKGQLDPKQAHGSTIRA